MAHGKTWTCNPGCAFDSGVGELSSELSYALRTIVVDGPQQGRVRHVMFLMFAYAGPQAT